MRRRPPDPDTAPPSRRRPSRSNPETGADRLVDRRDFLAALGGGLSALVATRLLGLPGPADRPAWADRSASAPPVRLRFLTSDPAFVDTRPCFSPSGSHVLFMRAPAGDDPVATEHSNRSPWSLWTVPSEGGSPSPFFEHPRLRATRPDWCWTSGRIAFSGIREGRGELWVLDASGEDLRHVAVEEPYRGQLFYPSWYPDGETLAVTDYRRHQVLRVAAATGEAEPLTDPSRVRAGMASVSPDAGTGSLLAFAGQRPGSPYTSGANSIWIRTENGTHPFLPGHGRMPNWSPSGDRLAFMSTRSRPAPAATLHRRDLPVGIPSLFTVAATTSGDPSHRSVTGVSPLDHWTSFPRWSPDARSLACRAMDMRTGRAGIALVELP